jgi:hypothetical protein
MNYRTVQAVLWIRIRIKVISWIRNRIGIRINLQMVSQNVWNMSLFITFYRGLSLYLEARIWIQIRTRMRVVSRIRIRIRIRIRVIIRIRIRIRVISRIRIHIRIRSRAISRIQILIRIRINVMRIRMQIQKKYCLEVVNSERLENCEGSYNPSNGKNL